MVDGSLLWIHGKRKYPITVVLTVINDWIDSRFWKDYSQVCYYSTLTPLELPWN